MNEKKQYKGTYQMPITLYILTKSQVKKREVV
jgi:uncharacterized protein YueI